MARDAGASAAAAPVPPSALEKAPDTEPAPPGGEKTGSKGLDYYLGTREGRSKLLLVFWIVSIGVMVFGYALVLWIWFHGGL